MAYPQNPDLDAISAFTKNGDGTVTATVSFTYTYAPNYVSGGPNVYIPGSRLYVICSETPANNGTWTVVSSNGSSITYSNANGVTQSNQFALCSPVNVSMTKSLTGPAILTAGTPFSYEFTSPTYWNPPPNYNSSEAPVVSFTGTPPVAASTTGSTTHLVTTITSTALTPNVSSATLVYQVHDFANLFPYKFYPSITLPVVSGTLYDDGSNYLTFDGDGISSRIYSKCNVFTSYAVNAPTDTAFDSVNGILYVADGAQNVVRKIILATGVESIIAGGAVSLDGITAQDGFGTSSIINAPIGLALDQTRGLLYVSEQDTGSIRKINLVTLDVTTERLGGGGSGAMGIAINPASNTMYIANYAIGQIEFYDIDTQTTTTLTDGIRPYALALDIANNKLYYTSDGDVNVFDLITLVTTLLWTGSSPQGLAVDSAAGVLYVSDSSYYNIHRITLSPLGISLVAGSGTAGSANGPGPAASFNQPYGIALDVTNHTLYVADNANNSIRKISLSPGAPANVVATASGFPGSYTGYLFAGSAIDNTNSLVYVAAPASNAILKFNFATGVTTLLTGACVSPNALVLNAARTHLYATSLNGVIYDVTTSSGAVTTLTGSPGSSTELDTVGIYTHTDPIGNTFAWNVCGCSYDGMYVAVGGAGGVIYASSTSGSAWDQGTGLPGSGTWSGLVVNPTGTIMYATMHSGYVYKSVDYGLTWVQDTIINGGDAANWVGAAVGSSTTFYVLDDGSASASDPIVWKTTNGGSTWTSTVLSFPTASGIACSGSRVIVTTNNGNGTVAISTNGGSSFTNHDVAGAVFTTCAVSGSGVYVVAANNGYIYSSTNGGTTWTQETNAGYRGWTGISIDGNGAVVATSTTGVFRSTTLGVWINITAADRLGTSWGSVFMSQAGSGSVVMPSAPTSVSSLIQTNQSPLFHSPQWIARDLTNSYLYITCSPANTLRRLVLADNTVATLGYGLSNPKGIVIDSTNAYAYVADGNRIVKVTFASGAITVIAGSATAGETDGVGTSATFNAPFGLALDSANGLLYVADKTGNKIRKILLSTASVVTIAGSGSAAELDGLGTNAAFNAPTGIVLNSSLTTLYVTDYTGSKLRTIDVTFYPTVTTDVLGAIPSGSNAITISGVTHIYSSSPTITCVPGLINLELPVTYTLTYNGTNGLPVNFLGYTFEYPYAVQLIVVYTGLTSTPSLTFDYRGPIRILPITHPEAEVPLVQNAGSSAELVPFISDPYSSLAISSDIGFTYIPSAALTYLLQLVSGFTGDIFESYTNTINVVALPLTIVPPIMSPLTLYTYQPFSYVFSLPDYAANAMLNAISYSSPALAPYITSSPDNTVLTFASTGATTSLLSAALNINATSIGHSDSIGSNYTTIHILPSYLVVTPPVPSGVPIDLYKYEPFTYTFSFVGENTSLTLRYIRSSPQLVPYITATTNPSQIVFSGTPIASYSTTFTLVIDLMSGTSVVTSVSHPVTISAGRITFLPASPYALNQYENISNTIGSNIAWSSSNAADSILSVPTLPTGLSFSTSFITGTPRSQQAQRNYQLIASNSFNGSISTAVIAISVGVPVVRITPLTASFTGLTTTSTPTATFTALLPEDDHVIPFQYLLPVLPSGLFFTDISNVPKSGGFFFAPPDTANTVKLAGTPDMTDAFGFPASGLVNVQLAGYFKDTANVQTIGTAALSFQFAEAVLMTTSVSSKLYVGKALGSNDVVITAKSYFPDSSAISTFVVPGLPAGLSVAGGAPWYLTGTPKSAGTISTTATATNLNGVTKTIPLVITINPDIVTFTSAPQPNNYIVSVPLASNAFQVQAVATSGSVVTYSSSLDFSLYGLSFNTTTGVLSGVPLSDLYSAPVTFTARDALGASATYSPTFTIVKDDFTWPDLAPTYFQNRLITPYQFVVRTRSGRPIQSFSSTNMPPGLFLSSSGLITGTFTGTTGGTCTVAATTGYQLPNSYSTTFLYAAIADNLLILQNNGIDPISNTFSNVPYTSVQYSTDMIVYPAYSLANVYPLQYPAPVFAISSGGLLSGDFTGVPAPYPTYLADIVGTYSGITSSVTVALTLNNTPKPLLLAGVASPASCNIAQLQSTSSYVFSATPSGTHVVSNQTWGGTLPFGRVFNSYRLYPDIGQIGTGFVAVTVSNVFDGVYNSATNGVDWTENTPTPSPITTDRFGCVASDGTSNWLLVQMSSPIVSFTRTGNTGPWVQSLADSNAHQTNTNGETTMTYIGGNYVFGQASNGTCCNILRYNPTADRRHWFHPTTPPTFSNILRFAVSNTTLVAVGTGAGAGVGALSYSTDYGVTWSMPSVPSWMRGPNVVLNDITYADNTWVTCGLDSNTSNLIAYSADLSNWQTYSNTGTIRWSAVAFNGNAWTIAGSRILTNPSSNQTLLLSLDAGPWPTQATSLASNTIVVSGATSSNAILFSKLVTAAFSNTSSFTGTVFIPPGPLTFTQPTQSNQVLYQYVPYTIPVTATGASGFIYYYVSGLPVGLQFVLDPAGTSATITGQSASNGLSYATLYAKTGTSAASAYRVSLNTVIPYFANPQSGAAASTAILREQVDADAAQNARDARVYPQVDSLAGPFMAPRAPDVVTQTNCFLKLCKKPCPTCRSTL